MTTCTHREKAPASKYYKVWLFCMFYHLQMALGISCLAIFSMLSVMLQIWKYLQSHLSHLDSFFLFYRWSIFSILSRWGSVVKTIQKIMHLHLNNKNTWNEWPRSDVTGWCTFMCDEVTPLTIPTSNLWLSSNRVNADTRARALHCRFKSLCPSLCGKEQSRESSLSPSPWHTQRENGSFGRPARGRKNGAQKGGPCREGGGEERRWQCKRLRCLHPSRGTSSPFPVMNCK